MPFSTQRKPRYDPSKPREKRKPKSIKMYMGWLLSRRDYSESELRKKLLSKEFTEAEVDEAVKFAQAHGFQSDARYAEGKARGAASRQGNYRVKQTLLGKGLAEDLVEEQIEKLGPEDERAVHAARKFEGKGYAPELRQKIYRFLAQRGFSSKAIKAAMTHLQELASAQVSDERPDENE